MPATTTSKPRLTHSCSLKVAPTKFIIEQN
jgi:hypothetical protein